METKSGAVRLSPLNSVVFACIFQSEQMAGAAMLDFLNAVLRHVHEEPIAEILHMRSEYSLMGESADLKYGRLDVRVKAESGRKAYKTPGSVAGDSFLTWLYLLDRGYQNEEEMEMLTETTEGLRNFAARYNYAINDPDLIRRYRMIEDGKRDIATKLSVATKRAAEQGRAQGIADVARSMKKEGIDPLTISRVTGIPIGEVNAL